MPRSLKYAAALPALVPVLSHSISNLRKEAALALGELGDAAALPALEPVAADPDPEVRKAARLALEQIHAAASRH